MLECVPLASVAPHGWTTRDLELAGDAARCDAGWAALAEAEDVDAAGLVRLRQVHGARVVTGHGGGAEADAIVSADPDRLLTVRVADCVPLLIGDTRTGAVAAVHAGWRGTAARIAVAAVSRMHEVFGSAPHDLVAAIGPAIRACCYDVGVDLVDAFRTAGSSEADIERWFTSGNRLRLDVAAANRDQLASAGVPLERVLDSGLCTTCHPSLFHSYRRDGAGAGRQVGFIRARGEEVMNAEP